MTGVKCFVAVVAALIVKNGALACSLESHKSDSSLCSSSNSDTNADSQHTPISKLHKTPKSWESLSGTSISSSNILPKLPNDSDTNSKQKITPILPLGVPEPVILSSQYLSSNNNTFLLNNLIQLLSNSTTRVTSPSTPSSPTSPSISPSKPLSITESVPIKKSYIVPSPCFSSLGSSPCSPSILPFGSVTSPPMNEVPGLQLPVPVSTSNADLINVLCKLPLLIPASTATSAPKLTSLSPLCSLFKPSLNKNSVPTHGPKPQSSLNPHATPSVSNSRLACILQGSTCGSSLPTKLTVPKVVPMSITTPSSQAVSETMPVEFPKLDSASAVSIPVFVAPPTPKLPTISDQNPDIRNILLKLLSSQAPTTLCTPLTQNSSPLCSRFTSPLNTEQGTDSKTQITSSTNATSSSSGTSSSTIELYLSPKPATIFTTPSFNQNTVPTLNYISSGYNPAFMKLMLENLLNSNPKFLPSNLSSSVQMLSTINVTPGTPIQNSYPVSPSNKPLSDFKNNLINILSNKPLNLTLIPVSTSISTPTPVSTTTPVSTPNPVSTPILVSTLTPAPTPPLITNTSSDPNLALINTLHKLLLSSAATSNTPLLQYLSILSSCCLSKLNISSVYKSTPNSLPISDTSASSSDPLYDLLTKLSNLPSNSNFSLAGRIPISDKPQPDPKTLVLEPVKNIISKPIPKIILSSPPPVPTSHRCHQKHSRLPHLPGSISSSVSPGLDNILRPHTPISPLPLLSHKLSNNCNV